MIKRVPIDTYREQNRGGRGIKGSETRDDDFVEHLFVASTHDNLLVFTDTGRVFKIKVYEVPEMARTSRGRSIVNLVGLRDGEKAVSFMPIADFEKDEHFLVFATAEGRVKRSSLRLYQNVNRSGIIALDLREGDRLVGVVWTSGHDQLLLGTAGGMSIRFKEEDARAMGRDASGVKGIELADDDRVVGLVKIAMKSDERDDDQEEPDLDLLTVTEHGYGKRTPLTEYLVASESEGGAVDYRAQSRGGKGRIDIRTSERNGRVVSVMAVHESEGVVLTTQMGLLVRVPAGQISRIGRATQGVRVVNLKDSDRLIAAATVPAEEVPTDPA
jgi:DNA gyrase subunit A